MSNQLNNVKISLRRDTLDNWNEVSTQILLPGEIAIVTTDDEENLKIGNGISSFAELPYLFQHSLKSDTIVAKDITAKSIAQGYRVSSTPTSFATGVFIEASANFDVVHGIEAAVSDDYAFVFNGNDTHTTDYRYESHGKGSFNVNPLSGIEGFYIGEYSLSSILSTYLTEHQSLSDYYKKSETSCADDLSVKFNSVENNISCKIKFKDGDNSDYNDLSVIKVTNAEYEQLVLDDKCISNAIYVLSDSYHDAYGKVISNLIMTDDSTQSEAATQHYVDSISNYIVNSLTAYYLKSETSSASEISNKFNEISDYYTKTEVGQVVAAATTEAHEYTDNKISTLNNDISALSTQISVIGEDYLTSADKWELEQKLLSPDEVTLYKGPGNKDISLSVGTGTQLCVYTATLSDFYLSSETSSANEISTAIEETKEYVQAYKNLSAYVETEVIAVDEDEQQFEFTILTKGFN